FSFIKTQVRVPPTHAGAPNPDAGAPNPGAGVPDSGVSVPIGIGQPDSEHGAFESVAFLTAALHVHGSPEPPDRLHDQRQPDPARARLLMALPLVGLDPVVLRRPAALEDRVDVLLVDARPVIADLDRETPGTTGSGQADMDPLVLGQNVLPAQRVESIVDEIAEDRCEVAVVPAEAAREFGGVDRHLDALFGGLGDLRQQQ